MLENSELSESDRCNVHWSLGIAWRELGKMERAVGELERARSCALELGDLSRDSRVTANLAVTLAQLGRFDDALELLGAIDSELPLAEIGNLQLQRGLVFLLADDLSQAVRELSDSIENLEVVGDSLAQAKAHLNLGVALGADHRHEPSLDHALQAYELATELGQRWLAAQGAHNVGYAAYRNGDVPRALRAMARAEEQVEHLDSASSFRATVLVDRARVLLDANLVVEAGRESDRALELARTGTNELLTAEATLLAARCCLRNGAYELALERAERAGELLAASGRAAWSPLASLVSLQAAAKIDSRDIDHDVADAVAMELAGSQWHNEACASAILAADALLQAGEAQRAENALDRCRAIRPGPTAVERSGHSLVRAAFHLLRGDTASARRAITNGLELLTDNYAAIGALELRAHASSHGRALSELGAAVAVNAGRPRELLTRVEQGRGATAQLPRARPIRDERGRAVLARLRAISHQRSTDALRSPEAERLLDAELAQLETQLRRWSSALPGGGRRNRLTVPDALRELGTRHLVEFASVNDRLWAVHARSGRTQLIDVGQQDLTQLLDEIRFAVGRLQRDHVSKKSQVAGRLVMDDCGGRLASRFLPAQVQGTNEAVVIVATERLHDVPWSIIPQLRGRPVTVAPSLMGWLGARSTDRSSRSLGVVGGPGLRFAARENASLAAFVNEPENLLAVGASVRECVEMLERVDIAHFSCHGRFRADSPLFSSLQLADGDLTFYDLEQCEQLPHTIVLSACNAGQNAVLDGGALLGMASALIQLGVSSVIAPLTPVNDERSVDLMVRLHNHLAAGLEPADALAKACIGPDGTFDATAAPFICFGS